MKTDCHHFRARLNAALDARQWPQLEPALDEHARHCAACDELRSSYEQLVALLPSGASVAEPSPGLGQRVVAELHARPSSRHRSRWLLPCSAAALLLVAAYLGRQGSFEKAGLAIEPAVRAAPGRPMDPQPSQPPLLDIDPGQRVQVLARVSSQMAGDFAAGQLVWVDPVADGLKPVRETMTAALIRLRQSQPRSEPQPSARSASPASLRLTSAAIEHIV